MIQTKKITFTVLALLIMLPCAASAQEFMQSPSPDAQSLSAQPPAPGQQPAPPPATQQQIDQLVAPIALYPDALVGQILMASTYPLEVVEAARWRQDPANAQLQGDQLAAALQQQPWDPSVKSIVAFPQVLTMMNGNLQWTEQLGDAFLGQQAAVSTSIQNLRQRAQAAGNLQSTPQQTVESQQGSIVIQPANPEVVYVPVYNPTVVYGAWPWVGYPPYYFPPPPGFLFASVGIIGFGIGIGIADVLWGWDSWDWHHHRIDIDNRRFEELNRGRAPGFAGGVWAHDPGHRHGVAYSNPAARAQFQGLADAARRNSFRGFTASPAGRGANLGVRPAAAGAGARPSAFAPSAGQQRATTDHIAARTAAPPHPGVAMQQQRQQFQQRPQAQQSQQRQSPPAFESFSRGPEVRAQSQRGSSSRSTMPAAAQQHPAVSAPQRSGNNGGGARNSGGHGGGNGHDDQRSR